MSRRRASLHAVPSGPEAPLPEPPGFLIVGVGASAGGLEAFRELLAHVPADAGLALVLVQHLEATRASLLSDALAQATDMKVAQGEQGMRIEPGRVYVIPPGVQMAMEQGALKLSPLDETEQRPHLPIDFFLRSLADERGPRAVGVILSGTASDGTAGLAAIRARGGLTFAQEPRSARFPQMPQSAVDAGVVDRCMPLPALGEELARLARHPYVARTAPPAPGRAALGRILAQVRSGSGLDFREHEPAAVQRQVARRMLLRGATGEASYLDVLSREPAEVKALSEDLLTKVTSFFRNEETFDELRRIALPDILKHKAPGAPIRAWVVGCATGEEVYSLAIALLEHLDGGGPRHPVLIFGSDLSAKAIATARAGLYPEGAVHGLGEERLKRFFVRTERGWRVSAAVREQCVFVRHDVARDPPFSRLDLVSCRNELAYLGQALQRRVLATAHYALGQPGYLLLDRSEGIPPVQRWFAAADPGGRLLRRKPGRSTLRLAARIFAGDRLEGPDLRGRMGPDPEELSAGEEALAANAEMVSANEELQSVNEELETAKEELQATNEELTTVNDELRSRNQELLVLNADVLNLLDAVEIPIVMLDRDHRVRRFTRRAAASMGLRPSDVGRPLTDLALPVLAPDLDQWIARAMEGATLVEAEVQDRAGRWNRLQVRPHRAAGDLVDGAILSLVDIQDLKQELAAAEWARDYARRIVEAVQVPLVVLSPELRVLSANAAYYGLFGGTAAETEGRGLFEIGGGAWNVPELRRALATVSRRRFQALEVEHEFPRAGLRTTQVSGCAFPSPASAPMTLLAIEDVTERRQGERHRAELLALTEEAARRAERADAAKDVFLANLSHELRTPLTTILLHGQALQKGLGAHSAERSGASIVAAARRQARLIEDLLDVSRIVSGKITLAVEDVDWRSLVLDVVETIQPEAEAKAVQLTVEAEGGPAVCQGDPARLQQVVANLLTNALKFTPRGGRVSVRVEAAGGSARLVVSDTGRGIDPSFLPRVFERFAQEGDVDRPGQGADDSPRPGLGLGLTIVRDMVRMHGGTVRVESAGRNLGATFTVSLPVREEVQPMAAQE